MRFVITLKRAEAARLCFVLFCVFVVCASARHPQSAFCDSIILSVQWDSLRFMNWRRKEIFMPAVADQVHAPHCSELREANRCNCIQIQLHTADPLSYIIKYRLFVLICIKNFDRFEPAKSLISIYLVGKMVLVHTLIFS